MSVKKRFGEFGDVPSAAEAQELTEYLKKLYLNGEADEIVLVYQSFRSVLQQTPVSKTLLPVQPGGEGSGAAGRIFEPDRKTILDKVVELYLNNAVFAAMLEARTGEHAARMTSMTAASDSTDWCVASSPSQTFLLMSTDCGLYWCRLSSRYFWTRSKRLASMTVRGLSWPSTALLSRAA